MQVIEELIKLAKDRTNVEWRIRNVELTGLRNSHFCIRTSQWLIRLALIDRPEDLRVRPFATGGFFQFWERLRKTLVTKSTGNDFPEQQTLIEFRP